MTTARSRRFWAASLFVSCFTPLVWADERSPVGLWVGQVSWSDRRVSYSWQINPDGTFTSGRAGRGHDGGGAWSANGDRLTLKYEDGFRYEGVLRDDRYSGAAYRTNGRQLGTFAMWRATEESVD